MRLGRAEDWMSLQVYLMPQAMLTSRCRGKVGMLEVFRRRPLTRQDSEPQTPASPEFLCSHYCDGVTVPEALGIPACRKSMEIAAMHFALALSRGTGQDAALLSAFAGGGLLAASACKPKLAMVQLKLSSPSNVTAIAAKECTCGPESLSRS